VNVIDVYFIDVNVASDVVEDLTTLLAAPELSRANRYRFADDRRRSIVARAAMRSLAGRYIDTDPGTLILIEEEHGKPALLNGEIEFNASHSGDLVALAFAKGTPVGIDVERHRTMRDSLALARRYFSAEELAIVAAANDVDAAFFSIWTAKEAIVKATGEGIGAGDLRGFTVPFRDPKLRPVLGGWSVAAVDPPLDGYYAAVAARADDRRIISQVISAAALL
jgi:4'-phosphopantetheinyl transferase